MSRTLIYLIAVFALWMYFSFGHFEKKTQSGAAAGGAKKEVWLYG